MRNPGESRFISCWRLSLAESSERGWSAVSDIGRTFYGQFLTADAYRSAEDRMVTVICAFHAGCGNPLLVATHVEPGGGDYRPRKESGLEPFNAIIHRGRIPVTGDKVGVLADLDRISRLCLREMIWCRLTGDGFFIEFGYDFIVFIGSDLPCENAIRGAGSARVLVEPWQVPELEPEEE